MSEKKEPYKVEYDTGTIKHLGLQMYSSLPAVLGELVANAWDADATVVKIGIPLGEITEASELTVQDNGCGMSDEELREKYLIAGRDRRKEEGTDKSGTRNRKVMGRKGIGKFAGFGIARKVEIETSKDGKTQRFAMDYDKMLECINGERVQFPKLPATNEVHEGTRIKLTRLTRHQGRKVPTALLRKQLARRFAVIGDKHGFKVEVNGEEISVTERDLKKDLAIDKDGKRYLWEIDEEIEKDSGWRVTGWIGATDRTSPKIEGVESGICIMARGKLVQEPFLFQTQVGQQYALSYLIGELNAEFVDEAEDTIGTSRNTLVWEDEKNTKLMDWGKKRLNAIARKWAGKRQKDQLDRLEKNKVYIEFHKRAEETGNVRAIPLAEGLVKKAIKQNPNAELQELEPVIQCSIDFLEFNTFWEITQDLVESKISEPGEVLKLFQEWEIVEAKEMSRVTEGRIATIEKLEQLITEDTLEVPTLHQFLREFPWIIDPKWNLVADEVPYSKLLREKYPDSKKPESDRRIDFLCVRENTTLVIVEIKRPWKKVSMEDLDQLRDYVVYARGEIAKSTDRDTGFDRVIGYLLCGGVVDTPEVRENRIILERSDIYIRLYSDLLQMVKKMHRDFIGRYEELKARGQNRKNEATSGETR